MSAVEFEPFEKLARLRRDCTITEKLDGTNAQVYVPQDDGPLMFGSRNRWLTVESDNYGFARWGTEHADELRRLGPGRHFGEWWGAGIQRRYGLEEKRFSLFNVGRWSAADLPACVSLVPILYSGRFSDEAVNGALASLSDGGSVASPGFKPAEGIVVYMAASRTLYKVTLDGDGHKGAK